MDLLIYFEAVFTAELVFLATVLLIKLLGIDKWLKA